MHRGEFDDMLTMGSQQKPLQQVGNSSFNESDLNFSDIGSLADLFEDDQDLSFRDMSVGGSDSLNVNEGGKELIPSNIETAEESPEVMRLVDQSAFAVAAPVTSSTPTVPSQTIQPHQNDVLLGRGGRNNQWTGNENLRTMARQLSSAYKAAPKRNKPSIAWLLVTKVRSLKPPGRYVSMVF